MKKSLFTLCFLFAVLAVNAQYIIHIAGNDSSGYYGDGIPAINASFGPPRRICNDAEGNLYVADGRNLNQNYYKIRKISAATGIVTTIAGNIGTPPYYGDSADVISATAARFAVILGLCMDKYGNLLIIDGSRVRKMNMSTGIITTVAGHALATGNTGNGGPATAALLDKPWDIAVDKSNNIYILDLLSNNIRKVDATTGIITSFAGVGTFGYSGDGGPATAAKLNNPSSICFDSYDNLYIADKYNYRIRKIDALSGIITTVAGNGTLGDSGDGGPASAALLWAPYEITIDKQNNVYIATLVTTVIPRIRKVDAVTGIISAFAGNGLSVMAPDSAGDGGLASAAAISISDMFFDTCDNMYIGGLCRIRAIVPTLPSTNKLCGYTINEVNDVNKTTPQELHLLPNPTYGQFTLRLSSVTTEPLQISVTDITGRIIHHLQTSTNKDTPVQLNTPPGIYFVTASSPSGRWAKKLAIQ